MFCSPVYYGLIGTRVKYEALCLLPRAAWADYISFRPAVWLKIESILNLCTHYLQLYDRIFPSAVTLSNKMLGYNELQYEIWADIMNINVDAAQSRKKQSEIVELERSACSKVDFR